MAGNSPATEPDTRVHMMIAGLGIQGIPVREWGTPAKTGRQGDWSLILLEYMGHYGKTPVSELSHWRVRLVGMDAHHLQSVCSSKRASLSLALLVC